MTIPDDRQQAALRAAHAILGAYDRRILNISADYLADTLRMVLGAFGSQGATHKSP